MARRLRFWRHKDGGIDWAFLTPMLITGAIVAAVVAVLVWKG